MPVATKKAPVKPVVATPPSKAVSATASVPSTAPTPAKKPATKATVATATPPAAVAPAVCATTPASATEEKGDKVCETLLTSLVEKVNSMNTQMKEVQNIIKLIGKEYEKQQKILDKVQKKRQNAKNSPSGFAKPNKISNELCDFIGVPHGTEKSRTDITRFINAYVKEHNLNKPDNRRFIIPDVKLKAILNVKDGEEINYFILQKLISHHFPPSASKQAKA